MFTAKTRLPALGIFSLVDLDFLIFLYPRLLYYWNPAQFETPFHAIVLYNQDAFKSLIFYHTGDRWLLDIGTVIATMCRKPPLPIHDTPIRPCSRSAETQNNLKQPKAPSEIPVLAHYAHLL